MIASNFPRSRTTSERSKRLTVPLTLSPAENAAFEEIAHERTARRPIRTYLEIPLFRAATMWFTPRIELLPYSGKVSPLAQAWEEDPVDLSVTIGFFLLNLLYVFLALWGAACVWGAQPELRAVVAFLALFVVLRTAFLTTLETPEPRYVIVCFPAILTGLAYLRGAPPSMPSGLRWLHEWLGWSDWEQFCQNSGAEMHAITGCAKGTVRR